MLSINELKKAFDNGLRLFLNTAVNNQALCILTKLHRRPGLTCDDMDSAKQQIRRIKAFAKANSSWYQIARDPWEARRIIKQNKMAVVLGVEVSNLFPRSHGDWKQQFNELYDMGVRSFEIAHEADSRFAGNAHQHGMMFKILNALKRIDRPRSFGGMLKAFERSRRPHYCKHPRANWSCNKYGLKTERGQKLGRQLVRLMMKRNMLIPLDHISRRSRRDIFKLAAANNHYPLFCTHSRADRVLHNYDRRSGGTEEYMMTDENLEMIRKTGGVFGLRTGTEVMREIPGCLNKRLTCFGSAESLAQNVCHVARFGVAVAMGTDMNTGPAAMTAPRFSHRSKYTKRYDKMPAACPKNVGMGWVTPKGYKPKFASKAPKAARGRHDEYPARGAAHIGLVKALMDDMKRLGAPISETRMESSAETFLRMWERTYARRAPGALSKAQYMRMMGTKSRTYGKAYKSRRYSKKLIGLFKKAHKKFPGDLARADAWFRKKEKKAWKKTRKHARKDGRKADRRNRRKRRRRGR